MPILKSTLILDEREIGSIKITDKKVRNVIQELISTEACNPDQIFIYCSSGAVPVHC